jgi:hypothetical protein
MGSILSCLTARESRHYEMSLGAKHVYYRLVNTPETASISLERHWIVNRLLPYSFDRPALASVSAYDENKPEIHIEVPASCWNRGCSLNQERLLSGSEDIELVEV